MAVNDVVLANDALVLTGLGPQLAGDLAPGAELLGVRAGVHSWTSVSEVRRDPHPAAARRLGTTAGLATVIDDVRVEGTRGPTRARELLEGDRLELIHPTDLAPFESIPSPLRGLEAYSNVFPIENGGADIVENFLEPALDHAGFRGERTVSRRWMHVRAARTRAVDWGWDEEADLVAALHVWTVDEEGRPVLRVRARDARGRALVLGALVASRRSFVVRATPAFSPVELHITEVEEGWPAYSPIRSSTPCLAEALSVSVTSDGWSAISDLLILRPRHVS